MNTETIAQNYINIWNSHKPDPDDIRKLVDPHYVCHDANTPMKFGNGPESLLRRIEYYTTAFPDLKIVIEQTIAKGDSEPCKQCGSTNVIVQRWKVSGTQRGKIFDIAPTNRMTHCGGISVLHFSESGKLLEEYVSWDALSLFQQLTEAQQPKAIAS